MRGNLSSAISEGCSTTLASSATIRSADASSGLMSISLIRGCSTTSWLNRTSNSSSAPRSTGAASAHSLQGAVNPRPLHHAAREGAIQRRQAKRAIAEDFDQLTARTEEQHRPKLRINAAAENQFVAVARDHRLHDDAEKICPDADRASRTASSISRYAARTAASPMRLSFTPPTSVLCVIVCE